MEIQEKNLETASVSTEERPRGAARLPKHDEAAAPHLNGSAEGEDSRLGERLGRAGTAVGNSISGWAKSTNGEASGGAAPKAAGAAAAAALAAAGGARLLGRPRRKRVAGIPVPGTRQPLVKVGKDIGKRLVKRS
jgi:hypothetical protein